MSGKSNIFKGQEFVREFQNLSGKNEIFVREFLIWGMLNLNFCNLLIFFRLNIDGNLTFCQGNCQGNLICPLRGNRVNSQHSVQWDTKCKRLKLFLCFERASQNINHQGIEVGMIIIFSTKEKNNSKKQDNLQLETNK